MRKMDDTQLRSYLGLLPEERKVQENPKKNWVDCLKEDCAQANIPYGLWTEKAKNRTTWQQSISSLTSVKGK
jgi:hypothetical protein